MNLYGIVELKHFMIDNYLDDCLKTPSPPTLILNVHNDLLTGKD